MRQPEASRITGEPLSGRYNSLGGAARDAAAKILNGDDPVSSAERVGRLSCGPGPGPVLGGLNGFRARRPVQRRLALPTPRLRQRSSLRSRSGARVFESQRSG
jgi:hypothetical protein